MKKRLFVPLAAVALVGLMAAFATTAQAFPDKTSACTGCHSGANIPVTATLASTAGTTATYNFSAVGADSVAVFNGTTKISYYLASSGQFSVPTGKTYTVYAVAGPGTGDGIGSTTVSPVAPVLDTTAPVTTSDAKTTYVSSAAVKLTATDAGTGVAATYHKLDGGVQTAGTTLSVTAVGSHTVEFWSTDVAGNIETHKTVSFTITAPVPTTDTYTVRARVTTHGTNSHIATLTDNTTGIEYTAVFSRRGYVVFSNVPAGTYTLSVDTKKGTKSLRTIHVAAHHNDDDDHESDLSHRFQKWLKH